MPIGKTVFKINPKTTQIIEFLIATPNFSVFTIEIKFFNPEKLILPKPYLVSKNDNINPLTNGYSKKTATIIVKGAKNK